MPLVADASAFLAYLQGEPGSDVVSAAMAGGLVLSTVNLAEVLAKLADAGHDPAEASAELIQRGLLGGTVAIEPFVEQDALQSARLRSVTMPAGLSLGDRACLALARRLGLPVITADRFWTDIDTGVEVRLIR